MQSKATFRVLDISSILPNRFQPRLKFEDDSLDELATSISRFGVIEPIVVRPIGDKYEIIAGERRYKASKLASMSTIPSIVVNLSDKDSEELALLENVQRQQLNPIEEAVSYKRILSMGYVNRETLAKKIGKPQSAILAKVRLLDLSDEVQSYLLNGKISERHARALLNIPALETQVDMLHRIVNERLTVKQTNREIRKILGDNGIPDNMKGADVKMDIDKIVREAKDINVEQSAVPQAPDLMSTDNMSMNQPVANTSDVSPVTQNPDGSSFDSMFTSPVNLVPAPESNNDLLNEVSSVAASTDFNNSANAGEPLGVTTDSNPGVQNNVSGADASVLPFENSAIPDTNIIGDQPAAVNLGVMPEQPTVVNPGVIPEQPAAVNSGVMPEQPTVVNPGVMPEQPAAVNPGVMSEQPSIPDFAKIIKQLRDCADEIEKSGHFVNLEEVDLGNQYKVIFTFDK